MARSNLPSRRKLRRAVDRYGQIAISTTFSKHAPRVTLRGEVSHGGRTPPASKLAKEYRKREAQRLVRVSSGSEKIRELGLRAGVLFVPYEEYEVRQLLIKAKEEFDNDGVVATDTYMRLNLSGVDMDRVTQVWELMKTAEVNPDGIEPTLEQLSDVSEDQPLNSFN